MEWVLNNSLTEFAMNQRKKLDEIVIWFKIMDVTQVKDFIIERNTEDQLYLKGIDSTGKLLKNQNTGKTTYAPLTIRLKQEKGGKANRVTNITLFDTGEYYESHEVTITAEGFKIDADPIKEDTNLFEEWGDEIVGLTDESLQKVITFVLQKYIRYTRDVIFARK